MTLALGCVALCSCDDSFVYDNEGDCSVHYKVRFKYDYNMKYADAFAHEVSTVTLYLLDQSGNVVLERTEAGAALAEEGYTMDFDDTEVAPGTYSLLVWCGTKDNGSFLISGSSVATGLQCTLNRNYSAEGNAYVDTDLDRLFHGYLEAQEFPSKEGTYTYTVSLVKDTNVFRIVLQHVTGGNVDVSKFVFDITDNNGFMDWNNAVIPDEDITYYAWHTDQGEAEIYRDEDAMGVKTRATFAAAIAEMTTPRLVTDNKPRLTVTNKETDKVVFSIPVIDYALLVKGFYNQGMDDQEFLDRQDEWDMVFFLDEGDRWVDTYIYINSWKIVLQNTDL